MGEGDFIGVPDFIRSLDRGQFKKINVQLMRAKLLRVLCSDVL